MKKVLATALTMTALCYSFGSLAQQGPPPGPPPNLTTEQKACLTKILGEPGQGPRPTHEQMDAAAKSCNLPPPPAHHGPPPNDKNRGQGPSEESD